MNVISRIRSAVRAFNTPADNGRALRAKRAENVRRYSAIVAANASNSSKNWTGTQDEYFNQEYLEAFSDVLKRAQDLDVNNPDVRGFLRTRTAQILGKGVCFRSAPHADEVGLTPEQLVEVTQKLDRARELHSKHGGFDSTGHGWSEGIQQVRAQLTAFVTGSCLIHRTWNMSAGRIVPLEIELIPGSRISTPFEKMGDPLVSYGIQYVDKYRSRIAGWWVRKVPTTRGNNFTPSYEWDFIPQEDGAFLTLTEMAGLDRAMPLVLPLMRMLRNRGEFIESAVESARAQSQIYAQIQCADGVDPWAAAEDDRDEAIGDAPPIGFMNLGGVQALYSPHGEVVNWNSARLPDPNFAEFMDKTDERCARGLVSSLSRFTRKVNGSWAGGRMEDQQDDPIIDQYRENFSSQWARVTGWFNEACWLSGAVQLPGYSAANAMHWNETRAEFPGKLHINPVDTQKARQMGFGNRTTTPQKACAEDGTNLREIYRQWAEAIKLAEEVEKEFGLKPGTLDIIYTNTATEPQGDQTEAEDGAPVEDNSKPKQKKKSAGVAQ